MKTSKLDDMLENLNGFGRYQKFRFFLLCLSGLLPPIASYMHSFIAASPRYICTKNVNVNETFTSNYVFRKSEVYKQRCYVDPFYSSSTQKIEINQSVDFNRSSFFFQDILYESVESDFEFSDKGADFLFSGIFSRNENFPHLNKCKSWFFEKTYYKETLTEEWNLTCDKAIWRSVMQAIYFTGMLVGSIVIGVIGRMFGQKIALTSSFTLIMVGSCFLSFGPQDSFPTELSYFLLVFGRFLIAMGSHGISINGYILVMETIGKTKRKHCSLALEFFFSFGQIVLVIAAYFFRYWRHLTFIILLPCLPFFTLILFSHESISFLLKKKEFDQIHKILHNIAKINQTKIDEAAWKSFVEKETDRAGRKLSTSTSVIISPRFCFIIIVGVNWIINNFIFHGLGLRANDLGINPYATFAMSALFEIVCTVFTFKVLQYKPRRKPYFVLMTFTGACCTFVYFSNKLYLTILSALLAKFSVSSAYAIIRLYSSELFPEYDRKSYMTKCSVLARLGSVIAPFIISIGDYYYKQLPFLVFGSFCFLATLSILALPEARKERPRVEDDNSQFMQNNWLDGQEIFEKEDEDEDEEEENLERLVDTIELSNRK